jgi:putative PIN family toxin of toxin-antitoxin system
MIRVVVDTNILISALLRPQSLPAQVFLITLSEPAVRLCMSSEIYAEYEDVICRPRLGRSPKEIADTLQAVREMGLWIKPSVRVQGCSDPDDDIFLECAQAAQAHYLVTGNLKDFPSVWDKTQIVTARQFLNEVTEVF